MGSCIPGCQLSATLYNCEGAEPGLVRSLGTGGACKRNDFSPPAGADIWHDRNKKVQAATRANFMFLRKASAEGFFCPLGDVYVTFLPIFG